MKKTVRLLASMGTAVLLASVVVLVTAIGSARTMTAAAAERPNILFIMTDDQPKNTMLAMPNVRTRIRDRGTNFSNAYISESICTPSRTSILKGQYPHNTGIGLNTYPGGGAQAFKAIDNSTVATELHAAGYETGLVGKYINGYDGTYVPPGWDRWYVGTDLGIDRAIDPATLSRGDRFRMKAMDFLNQTHGPFALFFWTTQPHLKADYYASRYDNLYPNAKLPPKPSYDEDVSDKPRWVQNLPPLTDADKTQLDEWRRNQLRSLTEVDDTVGAMLDLLEQKGALSNTYVVFTTDNGTQMGEHRWFSGHGAKNTAYGEAANVPMFVRGPGVQQKTSTKLVLNNDIAPTFDEIAGASPPSSTDGRSLLPVLERANPAWRSAVLNERPLTDYNPIPRYRSAISETKTYVAWATGEREYYNRSADPYEIQNSYDPAAPPTLASRLRVLKGCAGATCLTAEGP